MTGFLENITPVIIVKNGERHMAETLEALRPFHRVVVFDNGSTDRSHDIARTFCNVYLIKGEFIGFGPTKNLAASYSETPWIFSLDIDERPDDTLLNQLDDWNPRDDHCVGSLRRKNYFCGKSIRTNGWGGDDLVRLYNREVFSFNNSQVHEKIDLSSKARVKELKGILHHDAIQDVAQLLDKAQLYSEIYASSDKARYYPFPVIVLKAGFAFFRSYILKLGVISGWRGFSIAVGESVGVYFKYIKCFQRNQVRGRKA